MTVVAALTDDIAAISGGLAIATVLLLGVIGRRPARRLTVPAREIVTDRDDTARRLPTRRVLIGLALLLGTVAIISLGPFTVVVAIGIAAVVSVRQRRRTARARREAIEAAMPDAVELLVLCIHAGCSPTQAILEVAARAPTALRPVFAAVELQLHRGRSLADALTSLADAGGSIGREVAAAIATADREGQPLAPVLDRLTADARAVRRRLGEASARQLPVRLSFPLVVCTLPSFVLLAIAPAVLGALSTLRANAP